MAKKIKVTRKQLKQPDEFQAWSERAWDWAEENLAVTVGIVIGALVLIFLIQMGISSIGVKDPGTEQGGEFSKAADIMRKPLADSGNLFSGGYMTNDEKYADAIAKFEEVANKYPGTLEADMATLYLAASHEHKKEYELANSYFEQFAGTKTAKNKELFSQLAYLGMARTSFALEKYDESIENYNKIIGSGSLLEAQARVGAARSYLAKDEKDKASELVAGLSEKNRDSWVAQPASYIVKYWEEKPVIEDGGEEGEGAEPESGDTAGGSSIGIDLDSVLDSFTAN